MSCKDCKLCYNSSNPCMEGTGSSTAKIMFIQDFPDEDDDTANKPFSGKMCNAFKKSLELRGILPSSTYFTSIVRCVSEDKDVPLSIVSICQHYLEDEIKIVDPDIVVPTGNKSLKFCVGRVGLTKVRGSAVEVELLGRKRIILPMLSPKMIATKPLYKTYILKKYN